MKTPYGHLTYCSNIHPGESWSEHFNELKKHFPRIKYEVSPDQAMGIGLRLSNRASVDLIMAENLTEFKNWLQDVDGYVFTMNGFPYGSFHHAVVKDLVHAPDWTTDDRVEYTIRLFRILSDLLPKGMEGGISTSPLSYRFWHKDRPAAIAATEKATDNVIRVLKELIRIRQEKGQILHLDIEPEPDGLIETGQEFIEWYSRHLVPKAGESFLKDHITLCYDVCHFAIGYEDHATVIAKLKEQNIKVGKIQISAALKASLAHDLPTRKVIAANFDTFNEPTYLHQVVAKTQQGNLIRYRDLPDALSDIGNPTVLEWRAHYHVPVFREDLGNLSSTQADITEVLKSQSAEPFTDHLEVETYTWDVLPEDLKDTIDASVVRELNWIKTVLK